MQLYNESIECNAYQNNGINGVASTITYVDDVHKHGEFRQRNVDYKGGYFFFLQTVMVMMAMHFDPTQMASNNNGAEH